MERPPTGSITRRRRLAFAARTRAKPFTAPSTARSPTKSWQANGKRCDAIPLGVGRGAGPALGHPRRHCRAAGRRRFAAAAPARSPQPAACRQRRRRGPAGDPDLRQHLHPREPRLRLQRLQPALRRNLAIAGVGIVLLVIRLRDPDPFFRLATYALPGAALYVLLFGAYSGMRQEIVFVPPLAVALALAFERGAAAIRARSARAPLPTPERDRQPQPPRPASPRPSP